MPNMPVKSTSPHPAAGGTLNSQPSTRRAITDLFRAFGPSFLGLCCCNVWIGWMNGAHALRPPALWDALCAATMIGMLAIGVWWGMRHPDRIRATYSLDWPIALAMAAFTLPAAGLPIGGPAIQLIFATIATEIGMVWFYIRWGVFLSQLDLRSTVGCIFIAHVFGCTAKLVLEYVPVHVSAIPISLLPIVSMAALTRIGQKLGCRNETEGVSRPLPSGKAEARNAWCSGSPRTWGPLWKVAAFVTCYRLIFQLAPNSLSAANSLSLSTICCLAEIIVSLIIAHMMFVKSGSFTFQQVWSIFLLLLGASLLCSMSASPSVALAGTSIRAAAGSLLVMFTWLVFADISHHSALHPFVIFGIARIAYELPRLTVEYLGLTGFAVWENTPFSTGILFFALLVFSILFFDWRDPTLALIFSDFQKQDSPPTPDQVFTTCQATALAYGLTQREEEVLRYLCQGRTRAYIAETLYLSENTVRGHTQRIYSKLDVHNKTELQRKLGI